MTEAQVKTLDSIADVTVDGALPLEQLVAGVASFIYGGSNSS
jgi:hypothetical protein